MTIPPYGSREWQEWRRHGVGASEVAAIAGVDAWKGEYALALEKRGEAEPVMESWPMRMGHIMEPVALSEYERLTGCSLIRGEKFMDERWPHLWATLDGRVDHVGVEAKWTNKWTEVPDHVLIQAQVQMGVAGLKRVDIVRVSAREAPTIIPIARDDELVTDLCDMAEAWYVRYVEGDEMPPPDASVAASRYLDRVRGEPEMTATEEQAALVASLQGVRDALRRAEDDERRVINQLKASMAGAEALRGPGFRIAWKPTRERTTVDWRGVAEEMNASPVLVARYTTVSEGSRPFRVSWESQQEEEA